MPENKIKSNNTQLSNFAHQLEDLQNVMIENNHMDHVYGDGKNLVNNDIFRIENDFSDQLYMRKMHMPKNPTNTKDMDQVEKSLYSITIEEYNKKEKLWQE